MKVNRKINLVDAIKFVYNEACFEEIEKLLLDLNAKSTFSKERHPSAVGAFRIITWYAGDSPHKCSCTGVEGDYLIFSENKIETLSEKEFHKHYEVLVD